MRYFAGPTAPAEDAAVRLYPPPRSIAVIIAPSPRVPVPRPSILPIFGFRLKNPGLAADYVVSVRRAAAVYYTAAASDFFFA